MFLKGLKYLFQIEIFRTAKSSEMKWHLKREPSEVSPGFQEIIPWSVPHLREPPLSLETIKKVFCSENSLKA